MLVNVRRTAVWLLLGLGVCLVRLIQNVGHVEQFASEIAEISIEKSDASAQNDNGTLIIGAGLGTTGTHLVFHTTCHLGFPSIHWNLGCVARDNGTEIAKPFRDASEKHVTLANKFVRNGLQLCVNKGRARCGSALDWRKKVLNAIDGIVKDGSIQALHDNPYPFLTPYVIEAAHRYNKRVFVLLSERNPLEYAERRVGLSYGGSDPLCKRPPPVDSETLSGGAFDPIACIDYAGKHFDNPEEMDLVDVFTTLKRVVSDADSDSESLGIEIIANETKSFQDKIRERADFYLDMFERDGRTEVEDLANEILQNVPALATGEPPAQFVNVWKGTKYEDGEVPK